MPLKCTTAVSMLLRESKTKKKHQSLVITDTEVFVFVGKIPLLLLLL
jgi:hypothetical protein